MVLVVGGGAVARLAPATLEGLETDLLRVIVSLPRGVGEWVLGLAQFATGLVAPVAVVALLLRRRWRTALLLVAAAMMAGFAMALADAVVLDRDLGEILESVQTGDALAARGFPNSNVVAALTAVVTVSTPWLSRRWKRVLWGAVVLLVALRVVVLVSPALDFVLAVGIGMVVGSAVLLVFGSPTSQPAPGELLAALRRAGLDPREVRAPETNGAALRYDVADGGGHAWRVVLRTPDERDAELLTRMYRRVRYRADEVRTRFATLKHRVEHEAFLLTLAERGGVRVPVVQGLGETDGGSVFYIARRPPVRPAETDDLHDSGFLKALWAQVSRLHAAGVAHRRLALEAVAIDDDGRPWLVDFDRGHTTPTDRELARDVTQLLVETALEVGAEPAVKAAVEELDAREVTLALRMLQPLALPRTTRARAGAVDGILHDLRAAITDATGAPDLEPAALERVKPRTLVLIVASTVAFYSLLTQLTDVGDTLDAFANASPVWLLAALAASTATYILAAVAFQGAVADPIPFLANLRAQVAASFATLVGPAGAGGYALTGRFLERVGVGAAEAGAAVAVDATAGFVVHVALLAGFIVWTGDLSAVSNLSLLDSGVVLLVLAGVVAVVALVGVVGPIRRRVLGPVRRTARTGVAHIGRVFTSPRRVVALFGGSLALSLAYVLAVAATVRAFGGGLTVPQIAVAYLGAFAVATLAPTPGGLGALESAMIAGLTAFGLNGGVAVSATLTFRLFTFWLPVPAGWVAFHWMQRRDEL